jgi:valyl-tRNA synthetase
LGWDGEVTETDDLNKFLPTDVLVTGRDIIFLWVSRMMMLTKKFVGKAAFDDAIITGTVLGKDGKPMSKSRNNGVDPIEMFDKFGVDATRIYLASIGTGADIKWNDVGVETYRNFANKIWNATRFCLLNSENAKVDHSSLMASDLSLADKWIISRLNRTALDVNRALGRYEFHTAVSLLYHFFWDDFCDWYIELVKDEITSGDAAGTTKIITILEIALRMLHPFMPYLTEELWLKLPGTGKERLHKAYANADATIMLTSFPPGDPAAIDERAEGEMQFVIELIKKVRNIRSEMNIKASDRVPVHVAVSEEHKKVLTSNEAQILKLARVSELVLAPSLDVPKASARGVVTGGAEIAIPLEGLIDFEKERERLKNQLGKLDVELQRIGGQLSNANFVERAPAEKVKELRNRASELENQISTLQTNLASLN